MVKKAFFKKPTLDEAWGNKDVVEVKDRKSLLEILLSNEDVAIQMVGSILPPNFKRYDSPSKRFLQRADPHSVDFAIKTGSRKMLKTMIREGLLKMPERIVGAYSFHRLNSKDSTRIVLQDLVVGVKLFSYSENASNIEVKPYANCKEAEKTGAKVKVSVPSTTKGRRRYKFRMDNIPIVRSDNEVWRNIKGGCPCGDKQNLFTYKNNDLYMCHHEIAALYAIAKHFYEEEGNRAVYDSLPLAGIAPSIATLWKRIETVRKGKDKKMLSKGESSILLAEGIKELGSGALNNSGQYKDYEW